MNRLENIRAMSADGEFESTVPSPGVSKIAKAEDFEFKEPVEGTDREIALSYFEKTPIGTLIPGKPLGYMVHIPLKLGKIAQSIVVNGELPTDKKQKYKELYEEQEPIESAAMIKKSNEIKNLSDEDIDEDLPMEKEASASGQISQMGEQGPIDQSLINRRLNSPNPTPLTAPGAGKTVWAPKSNVSKHTYKTNRDIEEKTKKPWEEYKNPYKNDTTEKLASALGINMEPYQQANIWADYNTPALVFDILMLGNFGTEWLTWEPETMREMLERLGVPSIAGENMDKLQALQVMHVNDLFWEEEGIFEKVCLALNDTSPDFHLRQDLNIPQIAKAVTIAGMIKKHEYSHEIGAHVAIKARDEGFVLMPTCLSFAQNLLDNLQSHVKMIVPQVKQAYEAKWPAGSNEDALSVQLRKLYAVDGYVNG